MVPLQIITFVLQLQLGFWGKTKLAAYYATNWS